MRQLAQRDFRARLIRDLAAYVVELLAVGTVYFVLGEGRLDAGVAQSGRKRDLASNWICPGVDAGEGLSRRTCDLGRFVRCQRDECRIGLHFGGDRRRQYARSFGGCLADQSLVQRPRNVRDADRCREICADLSVPTTIISATLGVGSLTLAGYADPSAFASIWMTWWIGDAAGALVFAPFVVLWATIDPQSFGRSQLRATGAVVVAAIAVGVVAYSPLIGQTTYRDALGFLAILPLLWAALRCDQRATATVAVILSCFALWGTRGRRPLRAG